MHSETETEIFALCWSNPFLTKILIYIHFQLAGPAGSTCLSRYLSLHSTPLKMSKVTLKGIVNDFVEMSEICSAFPEILMQS